MVDRIPSVESSTLQFPSAVRAVQAANLTDPAEIEGAAVAGTFTQLGTDIDSVPLVFTTGTETRVLTPEAADDTFAPIVEAIFIPAKAFDISNGAPTYGAVNGEGYAWLLDPSTYEGVTTFFTCPDHWVSIVGVDIWWAPMDAIDGNTIWQVNLWNPSHNTSLSSSGSSTFTSAASSAGTNAYRARLLENTVSLAVDTTKLQRIRIARNATNGSDTYANDAALLGIRLIGVGA